MVRNQPLRLYQGDKLARTVTVTDAGEPANLSGYTVAAQIRPGYADDYPAITASLGVVIANGNQIILSLTPAETAALTPGRYIWDLQVTNSVGEPSTLLRGPVYVGREVTRP